MTHPERVRFAPSPTGELHIGGARVALYNWLVARQSGGTFILRIEDTDQQRLVPGSAERLLATLGWLGLTPDEGPVYQSSRLQRYQQAANQLVEQDQAYWCFCSAERLAQLREQQAASKQPPRYDGLCRSLSAEEGAKRRAAGELAVVRLRMPADGSVVVHDRIRGDVHFRYDTLDDSVLLKSDGFPTYHLAVVVDDHDMGVTLVLRGEEWLPSTPKHLRLYEAFGWQAPTFGHLPLILAKDRSKLSKRYGATSVEAFRSEGILPSALLNCLALLGWNPGDERELFSLPPVRQGVANLVDEFSLDLVNPAGAVFDHEKLLWISGQHLWREFDADPGAVVALVREQLAERVAAAVGEWTQAQLTSAIAIGRGRARTTREIAALIASIVDPPALDPALLIPKQGSRARAAEALTFAIEVLSTGRYPLGSGDSRGFVALEEDAQKQHFTNREFFWPLRVALSSAAASPSVHELLSVLSSAVVMGRLTTARDLLLRMAS